MILSRKNYDVNNIFIELLMFVITQDLRYFFIEIINLQLGFNHLRDDVHMLYI